MARSIDHVFTKWILKQLKAISENFSEIRTFQLYFMRDVEAVSIMIIATGDVIWVSRT